MSARPVRIAAIGLGNRTCKYLRYIENHREVAEVVAAVDTDEYRIEHFRKRFPFEGVRCFASLEELISSGVGVDACMIGTPDSYHYDLTMSALDNGWHVLLEKPMGQTPEQCREIVRRAAEVNKLVSVCYVLRHHPYFEKLKDLSERPEVGPVVSINHIENVGIDRAAHTFVRGPWNRREMDTTMFLAKCCHDVDFVLWIAGNDIRSVRSHVGSNPFRENNAPEGSALRCLDCPLEGRCPYSAVDLYYRRKDWIGGFIPLPGESTDEMIMRYLKESRYGRCVYRCPENDLVDRQTVRLEMTSGAEVEIIMESLTDSTARETVIICENAVIKGDEDSIVVTYNDGSPSEIYNFKWAKALGFHGEADFHIVRDFISAIRDGVLSVRTSAEKAVFSHLVCFAVD